MSVTSIRFGGFQPAAHPQPVFGNAEKPHLITAAEGYEGRSDDQLMVKKLYDAIRDDVASDPPGTVTLGTQVGRIAQLRDVVYLSKSMDAPLEKMGANLEFLTTRLYEGFKTQILKTSPDDLKNSSLETKVQLIQGLKDLAQLHQILGMEMPREMPDGGKLGLFISDSMMDILNATGPNGEPLSMEEMARKATEAAVDRSGFEIMFEKMHDAFKPEIFDAEDADLKNSSAGTKQKMTQGLRDLYNLSRLLNIPMGKPVEAPDKDDKPGARLRLKG